jgi:hypothetical protein
VCCQICHDDNTEVNVPKYEETKFLMIFVERVRFNRFTEKFKFLFGARPSSQMFQMRQIIFPRFYSTGIFAFRSLILFQICFSIRSFKILIFFDYNKV